MEMESKHREKKIVPSSSSETESSETNEKPGQTCVWPRPRKPMGVYDIVTVLIEKSSHRTPNIQPCSSGIILSRGDAHASHQRFSLPAWLS